MGTAEVIEMCEKLSGGGKAKVNMVPTWFIRILRATLYSFQWANDAADRLSFIDVKQKNTEAIAEMDRVYALVGIDAAETLTLRSYLEEYYDKMIKKLKQVG